MNSKIKLAAILIVLFIMSSAFADGYSNNMEERIIETNGIQTYCKILGEGEPLVIVHGGPGMAHNYLLPKFRRLAEKYQVIFYDQRACGRTSGEEQPEQITIDNLAEDLEALRNEFEIEKMNLIGQSWGGLLALNYAIRYPNNLGSLIILESACGSSKYNDKISENIFERLSDEEKMKLEGISKSAEFKKVNPEYWTDYYLTLFNAYFYDKSFHKELDLSYFTRKMFIKNNISEPMLLKYISDFDIYDELEIITCPTLIIHGKNDVIPYQGIERIHERIRSSEFILFENCGHFAHIEKNDEYFSAIEKFISIRN